MARIQIKGFGAGLEAGRASSAIDMHDGFSHKIAADK
jgi:hypothetical protein